MKTFLTAVNAGEAAGAGVEGTGLSLEDGVAGSADEEVKDAAIDVDVEVEVDIDAAPDGSTDAEE